MNARLIVSLLGVGSLAAACGPRSHSEASSASPGRSTLAFATTVQQGQRRAAPADRGLESQLHVLKAGADVLFAFRVANVGARTVEVEFPNGQTHEIVVVDSLGRELWRWSSGRMFTQAMRNTVIHDGDTLSIDERWPRPGTAGTLTAIATLRSTNFPLEQRVSFVLP